MLRNHEFVHGVQAPDQIEKQDASLPAVQQRMPCLHPKLGTVSGKALAAGTQCNERLETFRPVPQQRMPCLQLKLGTVSGKALAAGNQCNERLEKEAISQITV